MIDDILPKEGYKSTMDINSLASPPLNIYIVRRSDKAREHTFENGILKDGIIKDPYELIGLSLNILGGKFELKHNVIRIINDGCDDWSAGTNIPETLKGSFEIKENCSDIYFSLSECHMHEILHDRKFDKDLRRKVVAHTTALQDQDENIIKDFLSRCPITINADGGFKIPYYLVTTHVPIMLNYWHVQFEWRDAWGDRITKSKTVWKTEFLESTLNDTICMMAKEELEQNPPCGSIADDFYILPPTTKKETSINPFIKFCNCVFIWVKNIFKR